MRDRFGKCLGGLLPDSGGAVLLAVSGGIDSMVMADLFLMESASRWLPGSFVTIGSDPFARMRVSERLLWPITPTITPRR